MLMKITIVVEKDEPGFHAWCPALKGLHTAGETVEEAISNAREAVLLYLESLVRHGEPIPVGTDLSIERKEPLPPVPAWMIREITVQWPSPNKSGTS